MKVVSEALREISHALADKLISNSHQQAEDFLCNILSCNRLYLYDHGQHLLNDKEWATCQAQVIRRLQGEPLAYIQGKVDFYHCSIQVAPTVLIPRQETEVLVDKIVQVLSQEVLEGKVLWDVCCGSGCIGIALKKRFPQLEVVLADTSLEALELASSNARLNCVDVVCLQGNLLEPFQGRKANFFVCNPPYISEQEFKVLDREVREFEPRLALVGGKTGLEFYSRLADELSFYLHPHAKIWLELGYNQGEGVSTLFQKPYWKNQRLENDWAGHNRFFFLENE